MLRKNIYILAVVILIVLVVGYMLNKKQPKSDVQFQSLDNLSEELDSALSASQSLKDLTKE